MKTTILLRAVVFVQIALIILWVIWVFKGR